jgi:hypothetical protein
MKQQNGEREKCIFNFQLGDFCSETDNGGI